MPLPVFDGDRVLKELINSLFGKSYTQKATKTDTFYFHEGDDTTCRLSEYRIENVKQIRITSKEDKTGLRNIKENPDREFQILLSEDKFKLVDDIGDGFNDSVELELPPSTKIEEGDKFEVTYEFLEDDKAKIKKTILNTIRIITLSLIIGNFTISFIKFGFNLFWL
jgi:hypothetical protein